MISNSDHVAGCNRFHKDVCLDDGEMEVLLCKAKSKSEFIKSFLMLFLGQRTNEIISLKAHDVRIKLVDKPDKKWCIDGEKYDYDGQNYKISMKEKMKILTPKPNAKRLFKAH
jgi:diacylglycerol kinase family enzyme